MNKRRQILEAAGRVFRSKGLAKATTREIARDAGCAEGTLYLHFEDRLSLFGAVLDECLPDFKESLHQLEDLVGKRTVRANLEVVAATYRGFLQSAMGAICSIFAEPALLEAHRKNLLSHGKGPHVSAGLLTAYLRAEQILGRLEPGATPETIVSMLFGACFYSVFVEQYMGETAHPAPDAFVRNLVDNILRGAAPGDGPTGPAPAPKPEFSYAD